MFTISSFKSIENNHDVYIGKDCMKNFWEFLREHTMKIINFKRKKMSNNQKVLLTKEQQESYENSKFCYICKENFDNKYLKDKKYCKVRDHCHYTGEYRGAIHSICDLKYTVPKNIPLSFHDGSNFEHHFITKELAEEFKKQLFMRKCCKIHNLYSSNRKRVTWIGKNGEEITKKYILHFTTYW